MRLDWDKQEGKTGRRRRRRRKRKRKRRQRSVGLKPNHPFTSTKPHDVHVQSPTYSKAWTPASSNPVTQMETEVYKCRPTGLSDVAIGVVCSADRRS